jgi:hypothetical protein
LPVLIEDRQKLVCRPPVGADLLVVLRSRILDRISRH